MDSSKTAAAALELTPTETTFKPHLKSYLIVAAANFIYFAQLSAIVGSGFLAQSIAQLFDGTGQQVWLGAVINIFTMALNPPISQAADLWGRKWFLVVASAFGFTGCIIVSRAQSMGTVIAGYCILSIAYGCQSLLLAVVSEVLPRKHRPIAQAGANITGGIGAVLGLIMGGALINHGNLQNYRIYFYVNAAIFAVSSAIFVVLYNPPPRELERTLTKSEKLAKLDWVGYVLASIGLTLATVGLSRAYNPYKWNSAHVLAPFLVGILLLIAFIIYEVRFKADGVLHHSLFGQRNFPIAFAGIAIEGFTFFSCNNYYTFETAVFTSSTPLSIAIHFSVLFMVSFIAAAVTGYYSSRKKVVRLPLAGGFVFLLAFTILMATTTHHTSAANFWGYPVVAGVAFGVILPTIVAAAQLSVTAEHIALSSGLMVAIRGSGGVLSLAINNVIFNAAMSQLGSKIATATLPLGLPPSSLASLIGALTSGNQSAVLEVKGVTSQIAQAGAAALFDTYHLGFRNVWICASCFAFVVLIACLFLKDQPEQFNNQVDAPAEYDSSPADTSPETRSDNVAADEKRSVQEERVEA